MEKNENETFLNKNEKIEGLVQPISKKQLKRMKEREEWNKKKKEIKKKRKERKKEKKKKEREEKEKNLKEHPELAIEEKKIYNKPRKERNEEFINKSKNGIKIIIDCDFENLMNEKSNISMCRQISEIYSINRHSKNPFNLILYNVGDFLLNNLQKNSFEKWLGIKVYKKGEFESFDNFIKEVLYKDCKNLEEEKKKIYYLSADSENTINELDSNNVYIIGGIVDRNKYKGLSLNKAKELGINHGKFPIGEYLKLQSSQVLTTNHTFHILNEFSIKHDWKEAFVSIIPKRKQEKGESEEEDEKSEK
jgi:tRNA (guanine9-N1)-methyltransferase